MCFLCFCALSYNIFCGVTLAPGLISLITKLPDCCESFKHARNGWLVSNQILDKDQENFLFERGLNGGRRIFFVRMGEPEIIGMVFADGISSPTDKHLRCNSSRFL